MFPGDVKIEPVDDDRYLVYIYESVFGELTVTEQ